MLLFRMRLLIAAILFAVAPTYAMSAEELSVDAKSLDTSAGKAKPTTKKGGAKAGLKEAEGIDAVRPADLTPSKETKEFSWSGSYGGLHAGGGFGSTGQSDPLTNAQP
jgi:hypothetical protein